MGTFGLNHSQLDNEWPRTKWVRCWDIQCDPARIHLGPDQYDWSRLDRWFDKAASIGARTLYTLHGTPQWLAKGSGEHNAPWMPPKANCPPKDIDHVNKFAWNLATRYKGRLHAIEVGNEAANLLDFWNPITEASMKKLANIHKRVYKTVKSIDPDIMVVSNPILPRKSSGGVKKASKFIDAMSDAGWPCDSVGLHVYPNTGDGPKKFLSMVDEVRQAVKKKGGPKKLTITEASFDLLGPPMDPQKTLKYCDEVKDGFNGLVFWYAHDRRDLGGCYFNADQPVFSLF